MRRRIDFYDDPEAPAANSLVPSVIECEVTGIVGIYSDPRHVILYTSNGEVR